VWSSPEDGPAAGLPSGSKSGLVRLFSSEVFGCLGKAAGLHAYVCFRAIYLFQCNNDTAFEQKAAVDSSDIIFLATPWSENKAILSELQRLEGKILIDGTNPLKADLSGLVTANSTSGAEWIQTLLPHTKVVKALNTVGYNVMGNPR
jgi:hypothetical protein